MRDSLTSDTRFARSVARLWRRPLLVGLFGAAYVLAGHVGVALRIDGVHISAIWPPNALLFVALLLLSPQRWWIPLATASVAHVALQVPFEVPAWRILMQIGSNALLAVVSALLLRQLLGVRQGFDTLDGALRFLVVAVVCPVVVLLLPTTLLWLRGEARSFGLVWSQLALSNVMAFVALAPALWLLLGRGREWLRDATPARQIEAVALIASLIAVCAVVFAGPQPSTLIEPSHLSLYLPLPLMLWAAMRFGPGGASLATAATVLMAVGGAAWGLGPFSGLPVPSSVLDQQLFLLAFATPTLCVAALIRERQATAEALARANAELEQRIATRTADLLQANSTLERHVRQLSALNRITEALARRADLDQTLEAVSAIARELFGAGQAVFWLREVVGGPLTAYALSDETLLPAAGALRRRVLGRGETLLLRSGQTGWLSDGAPLRGDVVVLPLRVQMQTFGMVAIGPTLRGRCLDADDVALAQTIAAAVAVAVEGAQLAEQARREIAVQERRRLARELHDSVSQALHAATSMAEVAPLAYARSAAEGEESLRELHTLVRIAQAEMRTLLYELRPTALTTVPLSNLLQALAISVDGRLEAVLLPRIAQTPMLPADVQVALYRIAQEALQNCVKHAQADTASVELVLEPRFEPPSGELWRGRLRLTVADDGCGFDHAAVARGHGLDSITERAQLIGASCAIRSAPGEGTRVELVWEGEMVRG